MKNDYKVICESISNCSDGFDEDKVLKREQKMQWMYKQLKLIDQQQKDGISQQHTKIRCGCNKLVNWKYMYRCRYCGIWYCGDCADEHFGMKAETAPQDKEDV